MKGREERERKGRDSKKGGERAERRRLKEGRKESGREGWRKREARLRKGEARLIVGLRSHFGFRRRPWCAGESGVLGVRGDGSATRLDLGIASCLCLRALEGAVGLGPWSPWHVRRHHVLRLRPMLARQRQAFLVEGQRVGGSRGGELDTSAQEGVHPFEASIAGWLHCPRALPARPSQDRVVYHVVDGVAATRPRRPTAVDAPVARGLGCVGRPTPVG